MFTLEIATNKMEEFSKLMNKSNITYRTNGENADGSMTIIKLRSQSQLDKVKELVKNLV